MYIPNIKAVGLVVSTVFPSLAYVKHVTTGAGPVRPQGHNLNKLGKGPLDNATYQISRL